MSTIVKTALITTLALAAIAGAAQAAPRAETPPPSLKIAYADLDLRQPRDAAVMLKRIQRAAADLCRQASASNEPETTLRSQACYRETMARAVGGLNAPNVSALFAGPSAEPKLARLP